jgi:signal transduction histidine kinase
VELDAPAPGPTVRLDARALELMVFNLLDNAFKYAGDSETVRVRVRADGRRALLEVEDQGPGIDPEDARRVFERFYRGRAARRGQARGSGIGLALVQHIARAHGGQATVHPAAGPHGALFRVAFPAVAVGAAPPGPSGDSAGAEGTVDPRG